MRGKLAFAREDPVTTGVANSLAQPGGRVSGVAMLASQMDGKRASLLHEFVPAARRIAILAARSASTCGGGRGGSTRSQKARAQDRCVLCR